MHLDATLAASDGIGYWVRTSDNIRLRVGLWPAVAESRGSVFVFPGRTEYIEKYGPTVTALRRRGFATYVIDWRGQGLSDRLADNPIVSHVNRFSDYQKDVAAMREMAEKLDLPKPWFLLAHSMGGLIAVRALIDAFPFSACAFTAPMWGIRLAPAARAIAWPLTWFAQALGRGADFAPGNRAQRTQCYVQSVLFEGNRLTSDDAMFASLVNQSNSVPEAQTGAPSMSWVFESLRECRAMSKDTIPNVPSIALCGDADVVVDLQAISKKAREWRSVTLDVIPTARHDLLYERSNIKNLVFDRVFKHFSAYSH